MEVSESGFVFDPKTGASYSLNDTGARLFELLKEDRPLREILDVMEGEFEADRATLERGLYDFMSQLSALFAVAPWGKPVSWPSTSQSPA